MSLYRKSRSPYWHFDFYWRGHRFHGTTKTTTRREAEKIEAAERERAKGLVAQIEAARTSLKLQDVATRYWHEVGQHHSASSTTWHQLGKLVEFFGKDRALPDISDVDVAG